MLELRRFIPPVLQWRSRPDNEAGRILVSEQGEVFVMNILVWKETLKNMAPKRVRKILRAVLKQYRDVRNVVERGLANRSITTQDIVETVRALGIQEGDTILVHSSLSRLGPVEGGAEAVVAGLLRAVGKSGTIGAPTFWGNTLKYLEGPRRFDVRETPSILGAITEVIRKHPDARRSLHPTHSAAFIGFNAEYLTAEHHKDCTPVGPNSPYFRLISLGGKILLLGVTLEYMTNFHTIEDIVDDFPEKVYLDEKLTFNVIDENGVTMRITTFCHCPKAGDKRQCMKMEPFLKEYGVLRTGRLGHGEAVVVDAQLLHNALLDLFSKGVTMYNPYK